jgi:hypothetical protein
MAVIHPEPAFPPNVSECIGDNAPVDKISASAVPVTTFADARSKRCRWFSRRMTGKSDLYSQTPWFNVFSANCSTMKPYDAIGDRQAETGTA